MSGNCTRCGKALSAKQKWKRQLYCSRFCSSESRFIERAVSNCKLCKKEFAHKASRIKLYCSRKCRYQAQQCSPADLLKICNQCGKEFKVNVPSSKKLTCSTKCFGSLIAQRQLGHKQSEQSKARRSAALKAHNLRYPEENAARIAAVTKGLHKFYADAERSFEWRQKQSEYMKELMSSVEGDRRKKCSSLALKRAHAALREDTEFVTIWTVTLERLRLENPLHEGEDYLEYCRMIGKLLLADTELRRCADTFMSANLPHYMKEAYQEIPADA